MSHSAVRSCAYRAWSHPQAKLLLAHASITEHARRLKRVSRCCVMHYLKVSSIRSPLSTVENGPASAVSWSESKKRNGTNRLGRAHYLDFKWVGDLQLPVTWISQIRSESAFGVPDLFRILLRICLKTLPIQSSGPSKGASRKRPRQKTQPL